MTVLIQGYYEEDNELPQVKEVNITAASPNTPISGFGMWLLMGILLLNFSAVQKYADQGLAPLIERATQLSLKLSDAWLDIMQNTDITNINSDLAKGGDGEGAAINADTAKLNLHSTLYNQTSTFFSGITQAGQTNIGNENDITGLIDKMYQAGPLSTINTLYR